MPTYDDIIIGSGLSAIGTAIGLPDKRQILVIAGRDPGRFQYYDDAGGIPRAYLGYGGLGQFWHGVIPFGQQPTSFSLSNQDFVDLFRYFYPHVVIDARLGKNLLFIPRAPIRSKRTWDRERARRGEKLTILPLFADRFERQNDAVIVISGRERFAARRLWLAAGPLHSPQILRRSIAGIEQRRHVSDHVISYVGQIDRKANRHIEAPSVERCSEGIWLRSASGNGGESLLTLKPARFSYRVLDRGIAQRAAFGLPTTGALRKVASSASLGLIAEALYNKFGLFPDSSMLSVYAQTQVKDAYEVQSSGSLKVNAAAVERAIAAMHDDHPWKAEIVASTRRDLFIKAIHLHHSLDLSALQACGINNAKSNIQIVDASPIKNIGGEHHSFKLMVAAFALAKKG